MTVILTKDCQLKMNNKLNENDDDLYSEFMMCEISSIIFDFIKRIGYIFKAAIARCKI